MTLPDKIKQAIIDGQDIRDVKIEEENIKRRKLYEEQQAKIKAEDDANAKIVKEWCENELPSIIKKRTAEANTNQTIASFKLSDHPLDRMKAKTCEQMGLKVINENSEAYTDRDDGSYWPSIRTYIVSWEI